MHCMVLGRPITAYVAYKSILLRQISAGTVLLGKSHFSGTVSESLWYRFPLQMFDSAAVLA